LRCSAGGAVVCAHKALERDSATTIPSIELPKPLRTYTLPFVTDPFILTA
jgi:hypothetical protein